VVDGPVDAGQHVTDLPDAVGVEHPDVIQVGVRSDARCFRGACHGPPGGDRRNMRAVPVVIGIAIAGVVDFRLVVGLRRCAWSVLRRRVDPGRPIGNPHRLSVAYLGEVDDLLHPAPLATGAVAGAGAAAGERAVTIEDARVEDGDPDAGAVVTGARAHGVCTRGLLEEARALHGRAVGRDAHYVG